MVFQQILNGLTNGSIYALLAIGVTMIYKSLGMLNFAHGDTIMISAFICLTLITVGIPIPLAIVLTIIGKGKSVTYHVISREFELPELKLLVDAVQSSRFITHKKSNELIKKIEGFASRYEAQELQRQVFVANRIKAMNESIYYAVDYIHDAINRDVKIAFQYFTWDEHKQKKLRHDGKIYRISPWALTWDDENYYMIGYDSDENKIKHYRVDKMTKIQPTEEKRDGAEFFADFDMALYSKQTFGMYGGREETVTLRCENKLANVMIDKFGFDTAFSNITDTHFDMRVKVFVSPVFLTWIMNFGADVTILSPESVKDELTALASDVLAQYK